MTPTPSEPGSSQHSQYGPLQESPQVFQTALRRPNPPSTGGTHLRWPSQTPESVAPMQAVLSHEQATAWLVAHPPSQLTTAEGFMYDAVYQQVNAEAVRLQGLLLALQGAQPPAPARSTMSLPLPEQVYPGYTSNPRGSQSMPYRAPQQEWLQEQLRSTAPAPISQQPPPLAQTQQQFPPLAQTQQQTPPLAQTQQQPPPLAQTQQQLPPENVARGLDFAQHCQQTQAQHSAYTSPAPSPPGSDKVSSVPSSFHTVRNEERTTFRNIRKAVTYQTGAFKLGITVTEDFRAIRSMATDLSIEFSDYNFKGICQLLEVSDSESKLIGGQEDKWFFQVLSIILGGEGLRAYQGLRETMLEGSDDIISGVKMYHDLYKEFTPHTLMSRVNHDQFMLATGTMDGKIDYRAAPARFVAQIREGTRKYKAMYKEECVPESRICGIMLTRLPKVYDSAVKRLGTKPPGTQLTLQMVQEALITVYEHQQVIQQDVKRIGMIHTAYEQKEALGTKEGVKGKPNPKLAQQSVQRSAASAALKIKQCDNCGKKGHTWNTCWSSRKDEANEQPQSKPRGKCSAEAPQIRKVGMGWDTGKEFHQAQGALFMNDMNHIHENWEFATERECEQALGLSAFVTHEGRAPPQPRGNSRSNKRQRRFRSQRFSSTASSLSNSDDGISVKPRIRQQRVGGVVSTIGTEQPQKAVSHTLHDASVPIMAHKPVKAARKPAKVTQKAKPQREQSKEQPKEQPKVVSISTQTDMFDHISIVTEPSASISLNEQESGLTASSLNELESGFTAKAVQEFNDSASLNEQESGLITSNLNKLDGGFAKSPNNRSAPTTKVVLAVPEMITARSPSVRSSSAHLKSNIRKSSKDLPQKSAQVCNPRDVGNVKTKGKATRHTDPGGG